MNSNFGPRVEEVSWLPAEGLSSLQMLRLLGEVLFPPSGAAVPASAPLSDPQLKNPRAASASG
jgi:hypothetical protein